MTQSLTDSEFIKPKYLTEKANSAVNDIWPKVSHYIEDKGGVSNYLHKLRQGNDNAFTDSLLQRLFYSYFRQLLEPEGFVLESFNVVFEVANKESYGATNSMLMIRQRGTAKIPVVSLDIIVSEVFTITEHQVLETLFHELVHIEQSCSLLLELTAEKLIDTIPVNSPLFLDRLGKYFTTRNLNPNINDGEIESYARELALKIFHTYKINIKNLPKEERLFFLRTNLIPKYQQAMSPQLKEYVFDILSEKEKKEFLRMFVSQLTNFVTGLL